MRRAGRREGAQRWAVGVGWGTLVEVGVGRGGLVNQSRHRAGPHAHRYPWESPALSVLDLAVTYIMYADAAERPSAVL